MSGAVIIMCALQLHVYYEADQSTAWMQHFSYGVTDCGHCLKWCVLMSTTWFTDVHLVLRREYPGTRI